MWFRGQPRPRTLPNRDFPRGEGQASTFIRVLPSFSWIPHFILFRARHTQNRPCQHSPWAVGGESRLRGPGAHRLEGQRLRERRPSQTVGRSGHRCPASPPSAVHEAGRWYWAKPPKCRAALMVGPSATLTDAFNPHGNPL